MILLLEAKEIDLPTALTIIGSIMGTGGIVGLVRAVTPAIVARINAGRERDDQLNKQVASATEALVGNLRQQVEYTRNDMARRDAQGREAIEELQRQHRAALEGMQRQHQVEMGRIISLHNECEVRCRALEGRLDRLEGRERDRGERGVKGKGIVGGDAATDEI